MVEGTLSIRSRHFLRWRLIPARWCRAPVILHTSGSVFSALSRIRSHLLHRLLCTRHPFSIPFHRSAPPLLSSSLLFPVFPDSRSRASTTAHESASKGDSSSGGFPLGLFVGSSAFTQSSAGLALQSSGGGSLWLFVGARAAVVVFAIVIGLSIPGVRSQGRTASSVSWRQCCRCDGGWPCHTMESDWWCRGGRFRFLRPWLPVSGWVLVFCAFGPKFLTASWSLGGEHKTRR